MCYKLPGNDKRLCQVFDNESSYRYYKLRKKKFMRKQEPIQRHEQHL